MVAAAIVGAAVIGGAATYEGSKNAASAQSGAALTAAGMQYRLGMMGMNNLAPYNQFGQSLLPELKAMLGSGNGKIDPAKISDALSKMPGYQFALNQGLKSVQNSFAARGLGSSGAALRGASEYATGLAQQNYQSYLGDLFHGAQLGESAAAGAGSLGVQTGANVGNSIMSAGQAQAAGYLGQAAGINNAVSGISSYYMMKGLGMFNNAGAGG